MRVLALTNLYPPHSYGGYEWTCHDTMRRFAEHGHEVSVLTSDARVDGVDAPDSPDVDRSLSSWWDWRWQVRVQQPRRAVLRREVRNLGRLRGALRRVQPDVVSVWHMGGLGLSLLAEVERRGLPMVIVVEDDWLVYGPQRDPWRTARDGAPLTRAVARLAGVPQRDATLSGARVVFCSAFTRDTALAGDGWQLGQVGVEPLGIDIRDFPITPYAERPWTWKVLYVGRMEPQKGVETLLRAFARLPAQATLTLLGGGNEGFQASMRELAESLGVAERTRFGVAPREQLAAAYREADVLVFPSEWAEPFGLVPLEAMACAVPVVATGTGGSAEFLRDGENASLFRAGDCDDLVGALTRLAGDPRLRRHLVTGGSQTAERLTADRFAGRMLEVHEEVAGSRRPGTVSANPSTTAGEGQRGD
ncbi:MAG TPA: glycosyltransferase family 4 protein [Mycobacteriales bacterium]|nr:glycosyltransferase family 4 protein [Mycobacteriales bacterium]